MGARFTVVDGLVIAPDYSFTITQAAVISVGNQLAMTPPPLDIEDWQAELMVFVLLCRAEGYTVETSHALAENDYYAVAVKNIWESFKKLVGRP